MLCLRLQVQHIYRYRWFSVYVYLYWTHIGVFIMDVHSETLNITTYNNIVHVFIRPGMELIVTLNDKAAWHFVLIQAFKMLLLMKPSTNAWQEKSDMHCDEDRVLGVQSEPFQNIGLVEWIVVKHEKNTRCLHKVTIYSAAKRWEI